MKVIELESARPVPTLEKVMEWAGREDEFDMEVELLKNNSEFMAFMEELSQDATAESISSHQLRQELGL